VLIASLMVIPLIIWEVRLLVEALTCNNCLAEESWVQLGAATFFNRRLPAQAWPVGLH